MRCSDETEASNPSWRLNNSSDWSASGLASLKLLGVGFTVIDLHWNNIPDTSIMVECFTNTCRVLARLTRRSGGRTEPSAPLQSTERSTTTRRTTTRMTTQRATTRRQSGFVFLDQTRRPTTTRRPPSGGSSVCRAVGRWSRRPGMDQWCASNCVRFHCPRGVCVCTR